MMGLGRAVLGGGGGGAPGRGRAELALYHFPPDRQCVPPQLAAAACPADLQVCGLSIFSQVQALFIWSHLLSVPPEEIMSNQQVQVLWGIHR